VLDFSAEVRLADEGNGEVEEERKADRQQKVVSNNAVDSLKEFLLNRALFSLIASLSLFPDFPYFDRQTEDGSHCEGEQ
jgi:hypothetical protein